MALCRQPACRRAQAALKAHMTRLAFGIRHGEVENNMRTQPGAGVLSPGAQTVDTAKRDTQTPRTLRGTR